MKKKYFLAIIGLFFVAGCLLPQFLQAQKEDSSKIAAMRDLINSRHYIFKAQSALPIRGGQRQLNSDYDLQVSPNKIVSFLPYYGRAYEAPVDPTKSGLEFTSKDFSYNISTKKDGWQVTIKFNDVTGLQEMDLSVFNSGTASLQVISSSRQPISFNGYVVAPEKKK